MPPVLFIITSSALPVGNGRAQFGFHGPVQCKDKLYAYAPDEYNSGKCDNAPEIHQVVGGIVVERSTDGNSYEEVITVKDVLAEMGYSTLTGLQLSTVPRLTLHAYANSAWHDTTAWMRAFAGSNPPCRSSLFKTDAVKCGENRVYDTRQDQK